MKKKHYIIIALTLLIVLGSFLFLTLSKKESNEDAKLFKEEYTEVAEDNVFVYRSAEEVIKLMKYGKGVVYLGFPECPWCQTYVKYLNEVAKEVGVDKIYYYNILEDRQNNTAFYKEVVEILGESIEYDNEGNRKISVPNVSFHIDGELVGNDYETAVPHHIEGFNTPDEYWTEEEVKDLKEKLTEYMEKVYTASNMCTTCNK